jgi:hypothetical protein
MDVLFAIFDVFSGFTLSGFAQSGGSGSNTVTGPIGTVTGPIGTVTGPIG